MFLIDLKIVKLKAFLLAITTFIADKVFVLLGRRQGNQFKVGVTRPDKLCVNKLDKLLSLYLFLSFGLRKLLNHFVVIMLEEIWVDSLVVYFTYLSRPSGHCLGL